MIETAPRSWASEFTRNETCMSVSSWEYLYPYLLLINAHELDVLLSKLCAVAVLCG